MSGLLGLSVVTWDRALHFTVVEDNIYSIKREGGVCGMFSPLETSVCLFL